MRTDMPPFTDVRVRRAISHAIDRQGLIEAVWGRGAPTPGGLPWPGRNGRCLSTSSAPGRSTMSTIPRRPGACWRKPGIPKGFKTQLTVTSGLGRDRVDEAQLVQGYLKDVGIEAELKLQEYGAYMATTVQGKFEGMVDGPVGVAWEPDGRLYRAYASDSSRNIGHVNDPTLTAMLKEQRRTKDLEARKKLIFDIQRYVAEQQYYVYLNSTTITTSWQPYVKNFAPNHSFDYGNRAAALWLER